MKREGMTLRQARALYGSLYGKLEAQYVGEDLPGILDRVIAAPSVRSAATVLEADKWLYDPESPVEWQRTLQGQARMLREKWAIMNKAERNAS